MKAENKFKIKERVSKKGNNVICIWQYTKVDGKCDYCHPWVLSDAKYSTLWGKRMTVAKAEKIRPFFEKTIKHVFEIAVANQDWKLLPWYPLGETVYLKSVTLPSVSNDDIDEFFNTLDKPDGMFNSVFGTNNK